MVRWVEEVVQRKDSDLSVQPTLDLEDGEANETAYEDTRCSDQEMEYCNFLEELGWPAYR